MLSILETYHVNIQQLDNTIPINDYLEQAVGFTSAYSFPSCNPPRAIVYCTTSLIEHFKCSYLQESASVYGIEPNIQCIRENSLDACMENTENKASDVVLVNESDRIKAHRDYHLKPILYEFATQLNNRYTVVAVVKSLSEIYNFGDLSGKRACFPSYEGAAYLSVLETIRQMRKKNNNDMPLSPNELLDFFSDDSCTWSSRSNTKCKPEYAGDEGALRCLKDNAGDVAFVDMAVIPKLIGSNLNVTPENLQMSEFKLICPFGRSKKSDELCYLHWTSCGYLMINNQTNALRQNEIYNSLKDMDRLFGKFYESHIIPFSMYGPFDRQSNSMFHDRTDALYGLFELQKDRTPRFLEQTFLNYTKANGLRALHNHSPQIHRLDFIQLFMALILTLIHYF